VTYTCSIEFKISFMRYNTWRRLHLYEMTMTALVSDLQS
jgi:hypothetical protein